MVKKVLKKFNKHYCFNVAKDPLQYIRERVDTHEFGWDTFGYFAFKAEHFNEEFFREFPQLVQWHWIGECYDLSEEFIEDFKGKIEFGRLNVGHLSIEFVQKYADKLNWQWILKGNQISEFQLRLFPDHLIWDELSYYYELSYDFATEFQDKINWSKLSRLRKVIPLQFLRDFRHKIDWVELAKNVNVHFTIEEIGEFDTFLSIKHYFRHHMVSDEFQEKYNKYGDFQRLYARLGEVGKIKVYSYKFQLYVSRNIHHNQKYHFSDIMTVIKTHIPVEEGLDGVIAQVVSLSPLWEAQLQREITYGTKS